MIELEKIEDFFLSNITMENKYPPLFIIGNPRSGTTVLYLFILRNYKFGFFPNVTKENPQACISNLIGCSWDDYNKTYDNYYGILEGKYQPSDGWHVFNEYFPKYNLSMPIKRDKLYKLKNIFYFLEVIYNSPIINKNIGNSIRIETLSKLFPNSLFIWNVRNIYDNIVSILKGRKEFGIKKEQWFSTPPPQYYNKKFDNSLERVVYKVVGLNNYIEQSLNKIDKSRWIKNEYSHFCNNPQNILNWIKERYYEHGILLNQAPVNKNEKFDYKSYCPDLSNGFIEKVNRIITKIGNE